jgi:hypothetical protein
MIYSEARALVAPFLTEENAREYMALETDQMLWVEHNIMAPAGVNASICSGFGELVCEHVEMLLEAMGRNLS